MYEGIQAVSLLRPASSKITVVGVTSLFAYFIRKHYCRQACSLKTFYTVLCTSALWTIVKELDMADMAAFWNSRNLIRKAKKKMYAFKWNVNMHRQQLMNFETSELSAFSWGSFCLFSCAFYCSQRASLACLINGWMTMVTCTILYYYYAKYIINLCKCGFVWFSQSVASKYECVRTVECF